MNVREQNYFQLVHQIEKSSALYAKKTSSPQKKKLGQFFTDCSIAEYMSSLFNFTQHSEQEIDVLDCGAGHGILSIALIHRLILHGYSNITLTLYELDSNVTDELNKNLETLKNQYPYINFSYTIINNNFILDYITNRFDYIISNPPYFKLNKNDAEAQKMLHIVHGQPNIYMLFMAKSAELLKEYGEMVFITPRSFTSGTYFKKFREYLLSNLSLNHIHIFNSRKEHFKNENILQETIISKFSKKKFETVTVTSSRDSQFNDVEKLQVPKDLLINCNRKIIAVPSSKEDIETLKRFQNATNTFTGMGYKISTGKVVTFRSRDYLSMTKHNLLNQDMQMAPLLWMQNFKKEKLTFPLECNKEQYIQQSSNTKSLLIKQGNYIVVKRFSSKEQSRRINIGYIFKESLPYDYLGLENHLNYVYREDKELTRNEMKLLGNFLTSKSVDQYFRIINGNTQVNATDILNLPIPTSLFKDTNVMSERS